jgi:hypothetical protein
MKSSRHWQQEMAATAQSGRVRLLAAMLVLGVALSGCSSVVDHIPTGLGGLPEGVPVRSPTPADYPSVHQMPPARQEGALSQAERKRLRDELNETRKRVMAKEKAHGTARAGGSAGNP